MTIKSSYKIGRCDSDRPKTLKVLTCEYRNFPFAIKIELKNKTKPKRNICHFKIAF